MSDARLTAYLLKIITTPMDDDSVSLHPLVMIVPLILALLAVFIRPDMVFLSLAIFGLFGWLLGLTLLTPGTFTGLMNAWNMASAFAGNRGRVSDIATTPLGWLGAYWLIVKARYARASLTSVHNAVLVVHVCIFIPIFLSLLLAHIGYVLTTGVPLLLVLLALYWDGLFSSFMGVLIGWWVGVRISDVFGARLLAMGLFLLIQSLAYGFAFALLVLMIDRAPVLVDATVVVQIYWPLPGLVAVMGLLLLLRAGMIATMLRRIGASLDADRVDWEAVLSR